MPRYHVSEDGTPRVCKAASPDTCTALGVDGNSAPHGEFTDADEARRFAESVLEESALGNNTLQGQTKQIDTVEDPVVADRTAFSTDMTDSSEYRVEGGQLKVEFEGDSYDLGSLREVSKGEVDSWSQESFGGNADFQDGEVFPVYDEDGEENGAYARFGDKFYRAGTGDSFYQLDGGREAIEDFPNPTAKQDGEREVVEDFPATSGPVGTPSRWPMEMDEFDSRFDQGMFKMASEGDSAGSWIIEPRDEGLMEELKSIENLDPAERQTEFDEIMDDFGGGYLLSDGRTIRFNSSRR